MTLTISLTPEAEARLRQQAAAAAVEASRYGADLVEKAVGLNCDPAHEDFEQEQRRLRQSAKELLRLAEVSQPDPNPPRLKGQEADVEQLIVEKFRKQGLRL